MDDLSDTFNKERSELLYGTENAVQRGVQFMITSFIVKCR